MRPFLAASLALLLAGLPAGAAGTDPIPNTSEALAWTEASNLALRHNPEILRAAREMEVAAGFKTEVTARVLPSLRATAITLPPLGILEFNQLLFDRAMLPALEAADLGKVAALVNYRLTAELQLKKAHDAFLNTATLERRARLQREILPELEKAAERADSLFKAGRASQADAESIRVRIRLHTTRIQAVEAELEQARLRMWDLLGVPASARTITLPDPLPSSALPRLDDAVQTAKASRLDRRLLDQLRAIEACKVYISTAPLYPRLNFHARAEYGPDLPGVLKDLTQRTDEDDESIENARALGRIDLRWTLFDGRAGAGRKQQARSRLLAREAALRDVDIRIPMQVETALQSVRLLDELSVTLDAGVPAAKLTTDADEAWKRGEMRAREWLQFREELLGRELVREETRHQRALAISALQVATGQFMVWSDSTAP